MKTMKYNLVQYLKHAVVFSLILTNTQIDLLAQFNYPDFSSPEGLNIVGNAFQVDSILRLTAALRSQRAAIYYLTKQNVEAGFQTTFQFQFTGQGGISPPGADGIAFVIQNVNNSIIGSSNGGNLGYSGITNSIAIEFDTWPNGEFSDPNGNHISIQTRGLLANSSHHNYSLGSTTTIPNLKNGNIYIAKITYNNNQLKVFLDSLNNPVLTVNVNLATTLQLDNSKAYVGFTSATGNAYQNHDLISWSFETLQAAKTPVIFIPGIMGSPLFDDFNNDNHLYHYLTAFQADEFIWADTPELISNLTDSFLNALQLNDDGITS